MVPARERTVSKALAKGLIEEQFPSLGSLRLRKLGEGWDNAVFAANARYVFRFPVRKLAVPLLEREARVLPALGRLPLPVPRPVFFGRPSSRYDWPFLGYELLAGRPASRTRLGGAKRAASAEALGEFFRALHGIPPRTAAALGAGPDTLGRVDIAKRAAMTLPRLRKLARLVDGRRLSELVRAARPASAKPALLHGDPHAGQLLVDARGRVCAVIDWGDLHVGHPAVDLSLAHTFLPPEAHDAFRRAYGGVPEDVWRLARFRGLCVMAALSEHALQAKDAAMLRAGLWGLRAIASRGA